MIPGRLLIASKQPASRSEIAGILGAAGHQLAVAGTAEAAQPLLDAGIDLILIDHDHLDVDGYALAQSLCADKPLPKLHLAKTFAGSNAPVGAHDFCLNSDAEAPVLLSMVAALLNAQHSERSKDEFLSTVSHELRTPLNSILGWADILLRQPRDMDFSQGLQAIERNARLQAQMIADLLDVSRMAAGKLEIELSAIDAGFAVDGAIKNLAAAAQSRQITIDRRIENGLPPVLADSERLQQIVASLLSNAIKFSAKNASVAVEVARDADQLRISVSDSGRGIAPERLPDLLDRFRRSGSGLGLGLTIAMHLTALHGGTLSAHSEGLGKGARFTLLLPLAVSR